MTTMIMFKFLANDVACCPLATRIGLRKGPYGPHLQTCALLPTIVAEMSTPVGLTEKGS